MKKYLPFLLLLTGCKELSHKEQATPAGPAGVGQLPAPPVSYEAAVRRAEKQPLDNKSLAFGFRADMTQRVVKARVSQLDSARDVFLPLPSGARLAVTAFLPEFARDTLAELGISFYRYQAADYTSLREMLACKYRHPGFPHGYMFLWREMEREDADVVSWFDGPLEVQLVRTEYWIMLKYLDRRREQQHRQEARAKELREREEMRKRYRQYQARWGSPEKHAHGDTLLPVERNSPTGSH